MGCCVCVPQGEIQIIEKFGKFADVATPGCMWIGCCSSANKKLNMKIQQHNVKIRVLTKDKVSIVADIVLRVKIAENESEFPVLPKRPNIENEFADGEIAVVEEEPLINVVSQEYTVDKTLLKKAAYSMDNFLNQLEISAEVHFRERAAHFNFDDIIKGPSQFTHGIRAELNREMNPFGIIIISVKVLQLIPPQDVQEAMDNVYKAEKNKIAAITRAESDKLSMVIRANADAEVMKLKGVGIANERAAIVDGMKKSVGDFSAAVDGVSTEQVMNMVLTTQYLDTLNKVGQNNKAMFIVPSGNALNGMMVNLNDSGSIST